VFALLVAAGLVLTIAHTACCFPVPQASAASQVRS